jgi:hypothetical protein
MTDHKPTPHRATSPLREDCAFVRENLEAEALDILEPAAHARVQRHLQFCGPCRRALADLHAVTDLLPLLSEPATPSPMAKARLFQRVANESEFGPRLVTMGNPWAAKPEDNTLPSSTAAPAAGGGGNPGWQSWLMTAMVAPLAVAIIVLAAWANSLQNDLDSARSGERDAVAEIAADRSANQMRLYSLEPSCPDCDESPASGHLGGNPEDNVGILVAWNLNPDDKHEVWCEDRDGKLIRVSDLQVEQSGQVFQTLNFPDAIGGYTTIYVTRDDGTEEMRVALHEDAAGDDVATPSGGG